MNKYLLGGLSILLITSIILYNNYNFKQEQYQIESQRLQALGNVCPEPKWRSDGLFQDLLLGMQSSSTQYGKLEVLQQKVNQSAESFNQSQIVTILSQFIFEVSSLEALRIVNPFIDGFYTQDVIRVINFFKSTCNKVSALQLIGGNALDLNETSKQLILSQFSSNQTVSFGQVQSYLKDVKTKNCLYGMITDDVVIFLIDESEQMGITFNFNGSTIKRLDYVKSQIIDTIQNQLKPTQQFNIVSFFSGSFEWNIFGCQNATESNKASAIKYVQGRWAGGGSYISRALDESFDLCDSATAFYLLSHGSPTDGIKTPQEIATYLQNKNKDRVKKVKINTLNFMLGGTESPTEKASAQAYLQAIANSTGGYYRNFY